MLENISFSPEFLSCLFLAVGYFTHVTLKSRLYPTIHNNNTLILSSSTILLLVSILYGIQRSALLLSGFLISLIVHRLFLAPVCSFRGPLVAKLTKFWGFYHNRDGKYHLEANSLYERYGDDWIRVGPNEIFTRSVDAVKEIYGTSE
jgi:hypothetical protein